MLVSQSTPITKAQKREARIKLEEFLEDLEETHNNDFASADDWNVLLDDLGKLIDDSKLENILLEYDLAIPEVADYLRNLCSYKIISNEEIKEVYCDLKSSLEAITYILPRTYFRLTKWDKIPFASYVGFLAVFVALDYSSVIGLAVAAGGMIMTAICKGFEEKERDEIRKNRKFKLNNRKEEQRKIRESLSQKATKPDDSQLVDKIKEFSSAIEQKTKTIAKSVQFPLFATVFSIIAGWGIVESLYSFPEGDECIDSVTKAELVCIENTRTVQDLAKFFLTEQMLAVASFFAIAILFYHCGIIALSPDSSYLVAHSSKIGAFFSSLLIFLEGIVLFIAAGNTGSLPQFLLWIFILLVLDIGWVVLNRVARIDTLFQWLHLDSLMFLFVLTLLLSQDKVPPISIPEIGTIGFNYIAVLAVFVLRAGLDYKMGWNFWTKFTPTQ